METRVNRRPRRYLRSRITRKLILDTALKVFLHEGYAKTTIAKISEQANVGYGTVYSHYKGKDDILNKVVDSALDELYAFLETEFVPESVKETRMFFYRLMMTSFNLAHQHRPVLKIYRLALGQSKTVAGHWDRIKEQFIQYIAQVFAGAQKDGLAKKFNPHTGAKAYILLIDRFIWEIVEEKETDLEHLAATLTDMVFQGFFNAPAGE